MIGIYSYPAPEECHGIGSLSLQGSPLGYEWRVEQWFTKQRDRLLESLSDDWHDWLP